MFATRLATGSIGDSWVRSKAQQCWILDLRFGWKDVTCKSFVFNNITATIG